ncbi:hypothetical protein [Tissierella sp.]|uniref:hypothetical protein n=1 Tax=Tissierella sp. TaxID=41274 RepID=UPI00304D4005
MGCLTIIALAIFITYLKENAYKLIPFLMIAIIVSIIVRKNNKKKAIERAKEIEIISRKMDSDGIPIVATSLILSSREKCHYQGKGIRLITSRRVTRYEGNSSGASLRVAKGLTVRTGSSRGVPIREDVTDKYQGEIAITNKRIVFLGDKGFEFSYGEMTALDYYSDAIAFQVNSKRYVISSPEIDYIQIIVDKIMDQEALYYSAKN